MHNNSVFFPQFLRAYRFYVTVGTSKKIVECEPKEVINEVRKKFSVNEHLDIQYFLKEVEDYIDFEEDMYNLLSKEHINKLVVFVKQVKDDQATTSVKDVYPNDNSGLMMATSGLVVDETDVRPKKLFKRFVF